MAKHPEPEPRTLAQQYGAMKRLHPQFAALWGANQITWTGSVRPSGMSDLYRIAISYRLGGVPTINVLSPELVKRPDQSSFPHVYPGDHPCLYDPKLKEWTPADLIAETVLPWASEWLFFYEYWRATGEWLGGGEPVKARATRGVVGA